VAVADDPQRPQSAATTNVPVIADEVRVALEPYQNIRSASFAGWAPDGNGILVRTRFGNSAQLHRVFEPGGRREQMTFFVDPPAGQFVPQSPEADILLSVGCDGDEDDQLYLLQPAKFKSTLLTDGKSRHELGPVSPDGRRLVLGSNQRNGRDTDLYVVDTYGKAETAQLFHQVDSDYWYANHWSSDGQRLLMRRRVSYIESHPAMYDFAQQQMKMLPQVSDSPATYDHLRFSPDGKHVYLATNAHGEFMELARLDLETGKYEWLTSDIPWDVEAIEVDNASGRVVFAVNEGGCSRLYVLEPDGTRRQLPLPDAAVVRDISFSPDGNQLGMTLSKSTAPADAYAIDLNTDHLQQWTYSVVGGLDPAKFVAPARFTFKSFDGADIPAFVYKPKKAKPDEPVPTIVYFHGGPESQFRPTLSPRVQFLVREFGCAVVCPNVRGSTGYGKTFVEMDNSTQREDSVRDAGALLDWIESQPELDAERVTVIGHSYGGYMVLAVLAHYGERVQAGIESAGIVNFGTFLKRTEAYRQERRRAEYGDERDPEIKKFFDTINPTKMADKIQTPLLVVHGANDPRVPVSGAHQIVKQLKKLDRDVWAVFLDDEGHNFSKQTNRQYVRAVEVAFLQHHLGLN
jgi:dipeptidyl aminopeptidase/acylaminoacyl peptidase